MHRGIIGCLFLFIFLSLLSAFFMERQPGVLPAQATMTAEAVP